MTHRKPSSRHRSREVALQVLYALDVARRGAEGPGEGADDIFAGVADHFEMPEGAKEFARELVRQVDCKRAELDDVIGELAQNWRISRMAAVDRNILRLATSELIETGVPTAVILDEAVELARHFGSDHSPRFVNGILDAIAKVVREPDP